MRQMKILWVIVCTLILSGCIVKDSPAPGCVQSIGLPLAGGCFGKTAIVDLKVAGPECVVVEANNCNGGILEIRNSCPDTLQLSGMEILPSSSVSLDVIETEGGFMLTETDSNFSKTHLRSTSESRWAALLGIRRSNCRLQRQNLYANES